MSPTRVWTAHYRLDGFEFRHGVIPCLRSDAGMDLRAERIGSDEEASGGKGKVISGIRRRPSHRNDPGGKMSAR